jgi:hypothetical protein
MVIFDVEQSVREERWRARTEREDAMRKEGFQLRSRIGLFLDERLGFRIAPAHLGEEVDEMMADAGAKVETFTAEPTEVPRDIARRFCREVMNEIAASAGADLEPHVPRCSDPTSAPLHSLL